MRKTLSKKRSVTDIDLPEVPKNKKASTVPVRSLEGDQIRRYTEALRQIEDANAVIAELKPDLIQEGVEYVFGHNVNHGGDTKTLISSVKFCDKDQDTLTEGAQSLMVSTQKKTTALDAKLVNETLVSMRRADGKPVVADDYVEYAVKASFDTTIFNGADGFSKERYAKIMEALNDVSEELGVDNPLSCHKVMSPKGDWYERRWVDFSLEQNLQLQEVIPCVIAVKAMAPTNGE